MGILSEVMQIKQFEREKELADISQIGNAVSNFINMRQMAKENERQKKIDDLLVEQQAFERKQKDRAYELDVTGMDLRQQELGETKRRTDLQERQIAIEEKEDPLTDLKKQQMEADIELTKKKTKSSKLEELLERGNTIKTLKEAALAGDQESLGALQAILQPQETEQSMNTVDSFLPPQRNVGNALQPAESNVTNRVQQFLDNSELKLQRQSMQKDILGRATPEAEVAKTQLSNIQKQKESDIQMKKELDTAASKEAQKTNVDFLNAQNKLKLSFDSFVDTVIETKDITGLKPGPLSGIASNLLGALGINDMIDAFKGGNIETAAALGKISMNGARAIRLIDLFRKTLPNEFDTTESALNQVVLSYKNAMISLISRSTKEIFPDLDTSTLEGKQQVRIRTDAMINAFGSEFRNSLLKAVYMEDPELLKEETRLEVEDLFTDEEIDIILAGEGTEE